MKEQVLSYDSPTCEVLEIGSEGVICASMQQLYEYEDELTW